MKKRVILRVWGLVQGVGFRYNTKKYAEIQNLSGWVKNEEDGSVTVVAEGEEKDLQKLIAWVRLGPPFASAEKVEVFWEEVKGEKGFQVRYS